MINLDNIKQNAMSKLRNNSMIFLESILARMSISHVEGSKNIAWVKNEGGAIIYVGDKFLALSSEYQENVLIHEAMHIPQIEVAKTIEPFYDYSKAFSKDFADEEFIQKSGNKFESWRNKCDNYGFDAEINEFIKENIGEMPDDIVYPGTLPKFCGTNVPSPTSGLEFIDYVQYCIDELDLPDEDENSQDGDESQDDGDSQGGGISDLNPKNWEGVSDRIIEEAEEAVISEMSNSITYDGKDAGFIKGINEKTLERGLLPNSLAPKLQKIKSKMRPRYEKGEQPIYSWGVKNKCFPGKLLPGMTKAELKKNTKKAVVVLDSSGSMWSDHNFKIALSVAHWFNDKKLLLGLYCCDTELSKCTLKSKRSEVRGGGGTQFGKRHVEEIVKDVGHDIDIIYITDGGLDLREARGEKDVHLIIL